MSLRVINSAGERKVDSGLKMLIEPIYFWLLASKNYKKIMILVLVLDLRQHRVQRRQRVQPPRQLPDLRIRNHGLVQVSKAIDAS